LFHIKALHVYIQGFFGLFYSCYWVIFPIENSILFSQSTGKKITIESYQINILNKNSKIFANKDFFTVIVKMPS
jgi:hypothetical protein